MVKSNVVLKQEISNPEEISINDFPIKWCTVSLSDVIKRGKRLEASVYDVESMRAYQIIKNGKYGFVSMIGAPSSPVLRAFYGGRLKRNYIDHTSEGAIGFIGSSEMLDCYPKPVKFLDDSEKVDELRVKYGMVLISRSGTIGNMTFVNRTLEKLLVSEHAIRLECRDYPGYIYAYLRSKTGQAIIRSNIFGAVIQEIEPAHLAKIPVPDAPVVLRRKINDLIERSYALRDESNKLIDTATALLYQELHLPKIQNLKVRLYKENASVDTFSVKLSAIGGRIDASYHIPIVDAIVDHLKKFSKEVLIVGDERISKKVILPGRFKRIYVDEGHGCVFIGGKQLYELDPSNKKYLSLKHHADRISEQLELHENMTLITCSGTIGKVALVGKHWEGWTANQHIIRIVPASIDVAGYLNVFLASDYGKPLITHFTYGSVVDEIDDEHVRKIPIPMLKNQNMQTTINDLALEANNKRYEAYLLEQQALSLMDREVIFA